MPNVVEYVPPKPKVLSEKPSIRIPGIFLSKEALEDFGDIISLGQCALKIEQSGRISSTSTVPYTKITFKDLIDQIDDASAVLSAEQFTLYHRMLLINQLAAGNLEFFGLLPQAEYPNENTVKNVLKIFK